MTYASPFLDPSLDQPQPVTRTHPLAGAVVTERAGATPLNPSCEATLPAFRSASRSMAGKEDCASQSSGAPSLWQSILFAVSASAVPAAFAFIAVILITYRGQFLH